MKLQSTLTQITDQVFQAQTPVQAQQAMVEYLKSTKVKDRDKMITTVSSMNNLPQIQKYFANCLLKFEGHSLSKL